MHMLLKQQQVKGHYIHLQEKAAAAAFACKQQQRSEKRVSLFWDNSCFNQCRHTIAYSAAGSGDRKQVGAACSRLEAGARRYEQVCRDVEMVTLLRW